jgi:hypothetical protein
MPNIRWFAIAFLTTAGCGATDEQLHARAAIDLDCRAEAISSRALDSETQVADGCGHQAIYVQTCSGHNHTGCTWMLNSPVRASSPAPK